jgi:hypothetical protein
MTRSLRSVLNTGFLAGAVFSLAGAALAYDIGVRVNGEPVRFAGIGPQQVQGRVMVPLRGVLEKLGAYVDWVPSTQTVVASKGNMDLQLKIGSRAAQVNGREVLLDVPAMTMAGSTMVPLRFVGETLGADVRWDSASQTVLISTDTRAAEGPPDLVRETRVDSIPPRGESVRSYSINAISHDHRGTWLRPGEVVNVRMRGTAGGMANFRIPGVADDVEMREVEPGIYEGSWTVPGNKPLLVPEAAIIGSLKDPRNPSRAAPLVQAGDPLQVDTAAPKIADFNPAPKAQVTKPTPLISATLSDQGGSGIDTGRVRVLVDGREVTQDATLTGQFFTYTPKAPLDGGMHRVEVVAEDKAGNETRKSWEFEVQSNEKGIEAIQTDAKGDLKPGDVINVRVVAMPGATGTWSLGPVKDRPLRADPKPGVYVGSYRIRHGDDMENAHLTVTLTGPNGRKYTESFDKSTRVRTGAPAAPVIEFPKPGDTLSNPLVVRGTAQPNSIVRLKIDYANRVIGGVLGLRGTATQVDIKVDNEGKWQSPPLKVESLFGRRDTDYTLSAVAVNANEEPSPVTTLRIR